MNAFEPSYKEHAIKESGKGIDLKKLHSGFISKKDFIKIHENSVVATHDAVVTYKGRIVLMKRLNAPLKGFLWLPGGRILRGVPVEESLSEKVKKECGLKIKNIEFAGVERAFMSADPFGHGKGTDTIGPVFFCDGDGDLIKDSEGNHNHPILVTPEEYGKIKKDLHPFVKKYTDEAIRRLKKL